MNTMEENEFNPSEAYIVYASDDGFAEILGVSLDSLYKNSQDMDAIHVYILDSGEGLCICFNEAC